MVECPVAGGPGRTGPGGSALLCHQSTTTRHDLLVPRHLPLAAGHLPPCPRYLLNLMAFPSLSFVPQGQGSLRPMRAQASSRRQSSWAYQLRKGTAAHGFTRASANASVTLTTTWSPGLISWNRSTASLTLTILVLPSGPFSAMGRV